MARLAEEVYERHGYDMRQFHPAVLRRRLEEAMRREQVDSLRRLRMRIARRPQILEGIVRSLAGGPRTLSGAADFGRHLREEIIPVLRTYPSVRIWIAGCSLAAEPWVLAAMLREEGLLERSRIYATDLSEEAIRVAGEGRLGAADFRRWARIHREGGGRTDLAEHAVLEGGEARFLPELGRRLVFSRHNLATDASFNEFHLILCRNILSNLGARARGRVQELLHGSLAMFGYLVLGGKERPDAPEGGACWKETDAKLRIYRKIA
jgi:chemotaxis protein methyltransferase CheR